MSWFGWGRGKQQSALPLPRRKGTIIPTEESPYLLPNDLRESQRLDFQHYALRQVFQGNALAPITAPRSILDVGCGTGRWAHEMAQQYPQARVVGLDIVDVPAGYAATEAPPANYEFMRGNLLNGLPFPDGAFDYVHMRLLRSGIPATTWPAVARELVRLTAPGGWVESIEAGPGYGSPAMAQIFRWTDAIMLKRGVDVALAERVGHFLQEAGLGHVTMDRRDIPFGAWGERIGNVMAMDIMMGLRMGIPLMAQTEIADRATLDATLAQLERDLHNPALHCAVPFHVAIGRR